MENNSGQMISGADILLKQLLHLGMDTIFGYPGGTVIPVYDRLYDYRDCLHHVLVRHEQGAIHAAEGYARIKNKPGCVLVTSGPGATNVVTGIADAMMDSVPLVIIAGQVAENQLGTDAFQETDFIGMTNPISKWSYQIRRAEDVSWALARAYYIASTGRPGPVVLDFTKNAQLSLAEYVPQTCSFIRSYDPNPIPSPEAIGKAAQMIGESKRPFLVYGHGVMISEAEKELETFISKAGIPAASTMLGLSSLSSDNPLYMGMVGMHGNIAANIMTQKCDLLIAVGMRFSDRVTGKVDSYAPNAKIIHIDIDESEIGKNVRVDLGIIGDAKNVLKSLTALVRPNVERDWKDEKSVCYQAECSKVKEVETHPASGPVNPGEVVNAVAQAVDGKAVVVTDVGQNQLLAARYSTFKSSARSFITSGGLGTMGFGLPAAIGAKIADPSRQVVLFVGDGGFQMTIQELGTILQEGTGVKIVLLNNNRLGNVRQWQELFFKARYSYTDMINPDFCKVADAYGVENVLVEKREDLVPAIEKMLAGEGPFLLNVHVQEMNMVYPMIAPGKRIDEIMLNLKENFNYGK